MTAVTFSRFRIALIPVLLALIVLFEAWHFVTYFRLFTFIALFLLLADIASLAQGRMRSVLLVATSLLLGLIILEATANVRDAKIIEMDARGWAGSQPVLGWGPMHPGQFNARKVYRASGATIYNVSYGIDSHLLRRTLSCEKGPAIVFVGCSFTFGAGLNDDETFPQKFSDLLDRKQRVINLGFLGYGPQQVLRELHSGRFDTVIGDHPKLFIFLTAPWHAERTACKSFFVPHAPRYVLENGNLVFKGACNEGPSLWLREFLHNTATYRVFFESHYSINHDDIDLYIRITNEVVKLAKEKYGAPTAIAYMKAEKGYLSGTGFTDEEIIRRFQEGGALVVDASLAKETAEGIDLKIAGDGHPNAYANKLRASVLADYLQKNFPALVSPSQSACGSAAANAGPPSPNAGSSVKNNPLYAGPPADAK